MSQSKDIAVRFKNRDMFGNFCVILAADRVPFQLAGFQTVVMAKVHFDQLPPRSAQFYEQCKHDEHIEDASSVISGGTRHLPNEKEADKLLKQLADEF